MSTPEPEWSDEDYELATAFAVYEATIHPECGHPLEESTSIAGDRDNVDGDYFYEAELPIRCHACTARNKKQAEYGGENYDSARLWVVNKIPRLKG